MRRLPAALAALALAAAPAAGADRRVTVTVRSPHGEDGLFSDNPSWSLGAQFGNYGATGIVTQLAGFAGGALDLGLGLDAGKLAGVADYILVFSEQFHLLRLGHAGYNAFRGQLNPYLGGGIEVERGSFVRIPMGLQYTMLHDPFNFFGGIALMYGPFFADQSAGPKLWFNLGARVLL